MTVAALLAAGCSATATSSPSGPEPATTSASPFEYPGDEWTTIDPVEAGFDRTHLDLVALKAGAAGSTCLIVTRRGRLVAEWYWSGASPAGRYEVYSATKSYASTLVGIAQSQGKLRIDDRASAYIPQWEGTPAAAVTVKNLLSNDSGRHWDFATDYLKLSGAADKDALAIGLAQEDEPGTTWVYNNAAIQTLDAVLHEATGVDTATYARTELLDPIGMRSSEMTKDRSGSSTNLYMGLQSNCRDMARFGYLFLREGNWAGRQIVPRAWVAEATGQPSQSLNGAYGYLWWLNRKGPVLGAEQATGRSQPGGDQAKADQMVAGAPENIYWALGLGGQVIQVDPGSETVIVRLGSLAEPADSPGFGPKDMTALARSAK